jgi:hypothetical protein
MANYKFNDSKHLHTLDEKPLVGTSTVLSIIAKPLTWWASGLAVEQFGWKNPKKHPPEEVIRAFEAGYERVMGLSKDGYKNLLETAYKAHATKLKDSATAGTDLHAELEGYVKNTMENRMAIYDDRIQPFIKWSNENVKRFLWSEGHCYSSKLWIGGISDCGAELNDGSFCIIDFKSSKEAYLSQFWQCWGYAIQIEENGVVNDKGEKITTVEKHIDRVCIVPFGADKVEPVFHFGREDGIKAFESALYLYKLSNN